MKKKEALFIGAILLLALAGLAYRNLRPQEPAAAIQITQYNKVIGVYPLSKDQVIPIGDTNVCEIKDGQVQMIEADCPDQLCIYQSPISETQNGLIICLPNEVMIEGVNIDASGAVVDAVS